MKAQPMSLQDYDPLRYFAGVFLLTSAAGLAAIYRSGSVPERSRIFACAITSGMLGLAIALVGYEHYPGSPATTTALAILSGIGGVAVIDLVVTVTKNAIRSAAETKFGKPSQKDDEHNV